jgi:hypothetical protein
MATEWLEDLRRQTLPASSARWISLEVRHASAPYVIAASIGITTILLYLLFVTPARLTANENGVPVIRSRFGGLGAIGFYANRYQL